MSYTYIKVVHSTQDKMNGDHFPCGATDGYYLESCGFEGMKKTYEYGSRILKLCKICNEPIKCKCGEEKLIYKGQFYCPRCDQ